MARYLAATCTITAERQPQFCRYPCLPSRYAPVAPEMNAALARHNPASDADVYPQPLSL